MDLGTIAKVGIPIVIIIAVVSMRMNNKSKGSEQIKSEIVAVLEPLEVHDYDRDLFATYVDMAHMAAFEEAYSMGGRRTSAKFDEELYLSTFFESLIGRAKTLNNAELTQDLEAMRDSVYFE